MEKQQFIDQSFHKQLLEIRPGYPEMCKTPAGTQRVDISKTANTFYSGLHDLVQVPEMYSQTSSSSFIKINSITWVFAVHVCVFVNKYSLDLSWLATFEDLSKIQVTWDEKSNFIIKEKDYYNNSEKKKRFLFCDKEVSFDQERDEGYGLSRILSEQRQLPKLFVKLVKVPLNRRNWGRIKKCHSQNLSFSCSSMSHFAQPSQCYW